MRTCSWMVENLWRLREKGSHRSGLAEHYEALYAYAVRRLNSRELAEETAAEVIAAAFASRPPKGEILPWLYGIANRKVADVLRRHRKQTQPLSNMLQDQNPSALVGLLEDKKSVAIRALVDSLPRDQREAGLLFYVEDLSAKQVATAMRKSDKAVYSLLERARESLRLRGGSWFSEDEE